jgi:Flp pilus assembly protein TadG
MILGPPMSRLSRRRDGAHLVEFAVVVPVFFVFIFGLIEVGRGMLDSSLITNAARAGCRTGIIPNRTTQNVKDAVDNLLRAQGITGYITTVSVNGNSSTNVSSATTNDTITVAVSIPMANASWVPTLSFVTGTLTGQFSFPHE